MHSHQDHEGQLTCREFLDLLLQFVENEAGTELAALCRRHLEVCRACREYLASYQETRRLARAASGTPAGAEAELPEDLMRQILAAAGIPASSAN